MRKHYSRRDFVKQNSLTGLGALMLGKSDSQLEQNSPREVRVVTISNGGLEDTKDIASAMISRIKTVSVNKPDIICLSEVFMRTSANQAEEVPGPTTDIFSAVAKEYGCYIICPILAKKNGKIYNSAVLLDRKGMVVGQYNKIHPVSVESERGIAPGSTPPPVFKTDFGTIGMLICFDVNWTEEWKSLKEQGAEIVFWPSAFPGGRMLPMLAAMFKYYVVGSTRRDPSTIYDITGDLLASSGTYQHWAFSRLNLEKVFLETVDYGKKIAAIMQKYGSDVLIRYFHDEDWITIESRSPNLYIKDILKEYSLVPHWDYIKIEEKLQDKYRKTM
jgi:hypothetical protein